MKNTVRIALLVGITLLIALATSQDTTSTSSDTTTEAA
jgi:hypothetical protein